MASETNVYVQSARFDGDDKRLAITKDKQLILNFDA